MKPHADFMEIWEEGYLSQRHDFAAMHTQAVMVLDGAALRLPDGTLDLDRLTSYIGALARRPTARLRLQRSLLGLTPPAWVPDEDFDLSRHLTIASRPLPLAPESFRSLSGWDQGLLSIDHPLWRYHVTELEDGDVAIGSVGHHAMTDGISGMRQMTASSQARPEDPLPEEPEPFAGERPARAWEMPLLAARAFLAAHPTPSAAVKAYLAKPLTRRIRRLLGRNLRPWRQWRRLRREGPAHLPQRRTAAARVPVPSVMRVARRHGATMGDLLAAGLLTAAADPPQVHIRYPVSQHGTSVSPQARNQVWDMAVYGRTDQDLTDLIADIREQVASEGASVPPERRVGRQIGYCTLVPWVSRPRYFAGARIKDSFGAAAGLVTDEITAAAIMYDGHLSLSVTTQPEVDPTRALQHLHTVMTGTPSGDHDQH